MAKKIKKENKKQEEGERKLFAFLAVFLTIIGFVIALIVKRDDKYVMFYAKQGLVLFIALVIAKGSSIIPVVGDFTSVVLLVLFTVIWILTWINALSGEMRNTWLIGDFANKIKL